ncbi:MAG TPA: protein kinase [Solirubrobacteraceae bacterium]|nr:protein kinase [Solirubrobacteraceae bacterium]
MDDTSDPPTIASPQTGSGAIVAGRYHVRARLGRGATKEVYLAYDERLDRDVAVALVVGAAGSPTARARVTREAQVTGRLGDHPNVITVYDTGEHEGVPYLVLRAMPGGSLAERLRTQRPSIADAVAIARDVAAALAHAHAHDVVHRDVKPDNVWLTAAGSAALGDFGIAHRLGHDRLTAEGIVVGTVRYLSPEQIRGDEIGPASDLYALGVTLYELVAGCAPFEGGDATQVLTQHLTAPPEPPSHHEPAVPQALEELILALLAKEPARRPAAEDVIGGLDAIAVGAPSPPGAAPVRPRAAARRIVSVLAARADAGDPEALHVVLDRCATVIEQHGGTVERYLGDALLGFFGLEESHDDDALRAARAALELQATTSELRLGIEAGEVFVSADTRGATVATGAPITAAGRLAEGAADGEIVLGDTVRRVVAAQASVDPASGRLLELHPEQPGLLRPATTPFVGRQRERAELRDAFERVRDARACRLVTLAGPPGIGKSRLAREFLADVGEEATVLVGRCLSYGEGTTYRAVADIVRGLGGDDPRRRVEQLMGDEPPALRAILAAIGASEEPAQAEETAWAVRRLLERLARERPVVVAIEDIHWAEPVLLELLEHVATLSGGSPILLVCLTRPELLESRPAWAAPQPNRALLMLDALGDGEARELAERLGAADRAQRIVQRAEGNPLFVEQLVAVDEGRDTGDLPASIQAVLSARIDLLEDAERTVLQHAAVEGRTFHAGCLARLLPADQRVAIAARLVALARTGLIGGDQPEFSGEDAFRFNHALIREAAYASIPKLVRAQLHAGVAQWLERQAEAADEVVGFHFEQASVLAAGLGRRGERERAFATRAAQLLQRAARSVRARGDAGAATKASTLLERAVALLEDEDRERSALLTELGTALFEAGRLADAARVLDEAAAQATDARTRARARLEREIVRVEAEPNLTIAQPLRAVDALMPVLERARDDLGQSRAWGLRALLSWLVGQVAAADEAWRAAADCARRAGDDRELYEVLGWRATAAALGPMPVADGIRFCEEFLELVRTRPYAAALAANPLAVLHAMNGDAQRADGLLREADAALQEMGGLCAGVSHLQAMARLAAGQPELAEPPLRKDIETLEEMSSNAAIATTAALLAQALWEQGRFEEAGELALRIAADAGPDDIGPQIIWRGIRAKVLARGRRCGEAEGLAHEAVALAQGTDLLGDHAAALLDLADVLTTCGHPAEAEAAVRSAVELYERKGHAAAAQRARALLGAGGAISHP